MVENLKMFLSKLKCNSWNLRELWRISKGDELENKIYVIFKKILFDCSLLSEILIQESNLEEKGITMKALLSKAFHFE